MRLAIFALISYIACVDLALAKKLIIANHYSHSIPSGKSHYFEYKSAIIVFSIPANPYLGKFLLGRKCNVWELSRLWAPDGHEKNLLTQAIAFSVKAIKVAEAPEILVSFADPNMGHLGGVYRAASWIPLGQSEESRCYRDKNGQVVARRAFHSGSRSMTKAEILAQGYEELKLPGKYRFVKPLTSRAKHELRQRWP